MYFAHASSSGRSVTYMYSVTPVYEMQFKPSYELVGLTYVQNLDLLMKWAPVW